MTPDPLDFHVPTPDIADSLLLRRAMARIEEALPIVAPHDRTQARLMRELLTELRAAGVTVAGRVEVVS